MSKQLKASEMEVTPFSKDFTSQLFVFHPFRVPTLRAVRNPGVRIVYIGSILSRFPITPIYRMFFTVLNTCLGFLLIYW
jgi:hypothetical protein